MPESKRSASDRDTVRLLASVAQDVLGHAAGTQAVIEDDALCAALCEARRAVTALKVKAAEVSVPGVK